MTLTHQPGIISGALFASLAYLFFSIVLVTLGIGGIAVLNPDIFPMLLIGVSTDGEISAVLWLLLWPAWVLPALVVAEIASMPWLVRTVRGQKPGRVSERAASGSCIALGFLTGLGLGGAVLEQLLVLEVESGLALFLCFLVGGILGAALVRFWAGARARGLQDSSGSTHESFYVLIRLGGVAFLLAATLYALDQTIGPFQLGISSLAAFGLGFQPSTVWWMTGFRAAPKIDDCGSQAVARKPDGRLNADDASPAPGLPTATHGGDTPR